MPEIRIGERTSSIFQELRDRNQSFDIVFTSPRAHRANLAERQAIAKRKRELAGAGTINQT